MPYYPNWRQICKVNNVHLRMAMYTATSKELVALQRSFPHCFSRRRRDLCVPASLVRERTEAWSARQGYTHKQSLRDRETFWTGALKELAVPTAFSWRWRDRKCEEEDFEGTDTVPDDVWAQLEGKTFRCGHIVTYRGEQFVVVDCLWEHYQIFSRDQGEGFFTVAHARFIDLDS